MILDIGFENCDNKNKSEKNWTEIKNRKRLPPLRYTRI